MQFTTLQKDMMQAMKDHNKVKKDALSALVSATKKLAIDAGCRDDIPDEMTDQAILKEIKSIKEQIDTCPDSRAELKEEYTARLNVFEEYAPKMLSAEEIEKIIREKFADVIASGNKGMVMKAVMGELKGKAEGKLINETVAKIMA
ncbi:MAG: GatB/YqeY domain-containing protein [Lachnospiraceae bacterium]|nr:GatB/YqeY domain-containing protein [Lachnospiraceae bacterium]